MTIRQTNQQAKKTDRRTDLNMDGKFTTTTIHYYEKITFKVNTI